MTKQTRSTGRGFTEDRESSRIAGIGRMCRKRSHRKTGGEFVRRWLGLGSLCDGGIWSGSMPGRSIRQRRLR